MPLLKCDVISLALPRKVSYNGSSTYNESITSYWSLQARISPLCIISAADSADVSLVVKTLTSLNRANGYRCPFAVRSGGHGWPGSSNIESGIVLDLSALNSVTVSPDKTLTTILPGARWEEAYLILDTMGLALPGGRDAGVGVGGSSVGGTQLPFFKWSFYLKINLQNQVACHTFHRVSDLYATTS